MNDSKPIYLEFEWKTPFNSDFLKYLSCYNLFDHCKKMLKMGSCDSRAEPTYIIKN